MTNIPTLNRFVLYTLTAQDADKINHIRTHTRDAVLQGNIAEAGQTFPMLIVRVWGEQEDSAVNGQVFLDGNDVLWKTSVSVGEGEGRFAWPVRR
ncbi:hypothetical protein [Amycolatopsis kentuckyensis]|uniref:hypothetical protein n=1 Tax=Amycolatopsis kentuckyensis TaxID=218823 RepID=UPI00356B2F58